MLNGSCLFHAQGRVVGGAFNDDNETLITQLLTSHPELISLEMETFHLLDLARCSNGSIRAAAFCIAAAERYSNRFIPRSLMQHMEYQGGLAALHALAEVELEDDVSVLNGKSSFQVPAGGYVWATKLETAAVNGSQN